MNNFLLSFGAIFALILALLALLAALGVVFPASIGLAKRPLVFIGASIFFLNAVLSIQTGYELDQHAVRVVSYPICMAKPTERCLRNLSKHGSKKAQFYLALHLQNSPYAAEFQEDIIRFYKESSDLGLAASQNNLGLLYLDGESRPRRSRASLFTFQKSG